MRKLHGQYTSRGIAEDQIAVLETLSKYQEAINLFNQGIEHLIVPDSPIQINILGLAGSFAKGRGRLGVYQDLSFDAVHEMQGGGKINARNGSSGYMGKHWSGYPSEIYMHPSDLDIFVKYNSPRPTSLNENWNVDDAIKELSRAIYERTGVYISAHTDTRVGEYIPIEEIVDEGFVRLKASCPNTSLQIENSF